MKKILLSLLLPLLTLCAYADGAVSLPVLRVNFPGSFTKDMSYVNGTMRLEEAGKDPVELKAKFKTRGATASAYSMKPSFNMKLRTETYESSLDSALLDMRSVSSWILDAMAIDRVNMRNRTMFDIWNQFSKLPYETDMESRNGTEGRFVEVYINNTYTGIYCLSDKINRKLLDLKKYDEKTAKVRGVLYKSGTTDIADQNTVGYFNNYTVAVVEWHNAWELQEPEDYECEAAWAPLIEAIQSGKNYAYVKKHFFLDNLVDYQLFTMAYNISDNWGNKNHFFSIRNIQKSIDDPLPEEADRRRFVVTPWDLDTSLGGTYNGASYIGGEEYTTSPSPADMVKNGGFYPFSQCQGQAEYKAMLKNRWVALRDGALSVSNLSSKLRAYRDLLVNSGAWDRQKTHFDKQKYKPCYVDDLSTEVEGLISWYRSRHDAMDTYFGIPLGISDATGTHAAKPRKMLRNNRIVIEKGGKRYSISGINLGE